MSYPPRQHRQPTALDDDNATLDDHVADSRPTPHPHTPSLYSSSETLQAATLPPSTYPPQPSARIAFWKFFVPDSIPCRLYILVVILQTLIDLVLEGILLLKFDEAASLNSSLKDNSTRRLPVYFSIFCFAHVFQLILAIDAVWMRNTLQFFFLTAFNFILLVYAIVQISELREVLLDEKTAGAKGVFIIPVNVITVILPCIIAVAELAYLFLGWSIWREFGWKVYKLLGADRRVKRMYMHYQILQCFMKFDVFMWGGFSIQLIWMVLQNTNVEYYITVAALPASLVVLIAGHLGARYEHKPLMYAFMASCMGACAYFAFKLFRVIEQREKFNIKPVFKSLASFAAIALLFLVATFTWSCIVLTNFGAGLKHQMTKRKEPVARAKRRGQNEPWEDGVDIAMKGQGKRMSIE